METQQWSEWDSVLMAQALVKAWIDEPTDHDFNKTDWSLEVREAAASNVCGDALQAWSEDWRPGRAKRLEMIYVSQQEMSYVSHREVSYVSRYRTSRHQTARRSKRKAPKQEVESCRIDIPEELNLQQHTLYEGNFVEWVTELQKQLDQLRQDCKSVPTGRFSTHIWLPMPHYVASVDSMAERWEADDIAVYQCVLNNVRHAFLRRLDLPIDNCMTAAALVKQLEKGCQPFPFDQLPREIRDRVYKYSLIVSIERDSRYARIPFSYERRPGHITAIDCHHEYSAGGNGPVAIKRHDKTPSLINVSRQIRAEAGQVYYEQNKFDMFVEVRRDIYSGDSPDPLMMVRDWARVFTRDLTCHLRQLEVHIKCMSGGEQTQIRVKLSRERGIQAWFTSGRVSIRRSLVKTKVAPDYVSAINQKKDSMGWKGEAIADFFTGNMKGLRTVYFGPPTMRPLGGGPAVPCKPFEADNWVW